MEPARKPETHKNKHRAALRPLDLPSLALSSGGLGFLRPAPGTWGSVPPCAVAFLLALVGVDTNIQIVAVAVLLVASSVACVVWGKYAEERFGLKDAPEVVADETAGVCPPVFAAILMATTIVESFALIAWAFVLFRIMDILKPWPARQLEALPHGWGVLIDDLFAGIYALVAFILSMMALRALGAV